jgi:hypothetical protein
LSYFRYHYLSYSIADEEIAQCFKWQDQGWNKSSISQKTWYTFKNDLENHQSNQGNRKKLIHWVRNKSCTMTITWYALESICIWLTYVSVPIDHDTIGVSLGFPSFVVLFFSSLTALLFFLAYSVIHPFLFVSFCSWLLSVFSLFFSSRLPCNDTCTIGYVFFDFYVFTLLVDCRFFTLYRFIAFHW